MPHKPAGSSESTPTSCKHRFDPLNPPIDLHHRRVWLASTRMTRALEFRTWQNECNRRRSAMYRLVNSAVFLTILCLAYTNLVFAIKFDRTTCKDWLTTCVIALVVEAILQQPVVLLMTGVLGDYVEEGADFLLEVLEF